MRTAHSKDIWRSLKRGKKRFVSILLITALGVTMLTGLTAACKDLRASADSFFDGQGLFDVSIMSTLGLTDEDVTALQALDGVAAAEGAYSEMVYTAVDGRRMSVEMKTISAAGINVPYLVEGALPQTANEIAVTQKYLQNTGKRVGASIVIEESLETANDSKEDALLEPAAETPSFPNTTYTISGVVIDPTDVNSPDGAVAFRSAVASDYTFFVLPVAVDSEVYTAVYLTLTDAAPMLCYSPEYEALVRDMTEKIEQQVKTQREIARYNAVIAEAEEKLADAQQEIDEKFAEADEEFAKAEQELANGRAELDDGLRTLQEEEQKANQALADAHAQINSGYAEMASGAAQLDAAEKQLTDGENQLAQGRQMLEAAQRDAQAQLDAARTQLTAAQAAAQAPHDQLTQTAAPIVEAMSDTTKSAWNTVLTDLQGVFAPACALQLQLQQMQAQLALLTPGTPEYTELEIQYTALTAQYAQTQSDANTAAAGVCGVFFAANPSLDATALTPLAMGLGQTGATLALLGEQLAQLDAQQAAAQAQFDAAWRELEANAAKLAEGRAQLAAGRAELESGSAQLAEGAAELVRQEEEARQKLADARQELADGTRELTDGEQELLDNKAEVEEKRAEALQKLEDARDALTDIDMTQWYVQDRGTLSGYVNVESDAASIEAVGTAFPIVFFIVAILISLTTITRMVEEERGVIGTYKALGFSNGEIRRKYLLYAGAACVLGGLLGDFCGFVVLPKIVFSIFSVMYVLPTYTLQFDLAYGLGGAMLFVAGIVGATVLACRAELRQTPAALMRPKAPRIGSRVFLERITPLWKRLSFLNKVTARNLFRYKKRLFMTVAGIMGCTALVLCAFAIKDSVSDLMPRQYERVYQYDILAATTGEDNDALLALLDGNAEVERYLNTQLENVKIKTATGEEKVQMIIVPQGASLDGYIQLLDLSGAPMQLADGGIYVTRNAATVLNFAQGDTVALQNLSLEEHTATVTSLVENYLGNMVYMTQATYEEMFGAFEPNGALIALSAQCTDEPAFADTLSRNKAVLSAVSTQELRADFSTAFALINMVVYIILFMAAGLAFVVLFTLSTTNISERERELATIKVLGFFDNEVHSYVNKETLLLTALGILCGLPLGHALGSALSLVLQLPSIYFAVSIFPISYVLAAAISFCFALLVDLLTNRVLDRIDPVEALKSIE